MGDGNLCIKIPRPNQFSHSSRNPNQPWYPTPVASKPLYPCPGAQEVLLTLVSHCQNILVSLTLMVE